MPGKELSRYRTLAHVPNYPKWFWDQAISGLDRARFPNLQQLVDPDGSNSDRWTSLKSIELQTFKFPRYDYNKFLQAGAALRIGKRGLKVESGDNLDKTGTA